jgi:serine/threonine protein kinase
MATGVLPFRGESSGVIFEAILNRAPHAAGRLNVEVPAELDRIIQKDLEKDRELRYQHASEMRADLNRVARDSSGSGKTGAHGGTENAEATGKEGREKESRSRREHRLAR